MRSRSITAAAATTAAAEWNGILIKKMLSVEQGQLTYFIAYLDMESGEIPIYGILK